jgi:hypothetical protein
MELSPDSEVFDFDFPGWLSFVPLLNNPHFVLGTLVYKSTANQVRRLFDVGCESKTWKNRQNECLNVPKQHSLDVLGKPNSGAYMLCRGYAGVP